MSLLVSLARTTHFFSNTTLNAHFSPRVVVLLRSRTFCRVIRADLCKQLTFEKMDFQRLQQLLANMPGRNGPAMDTPLPDTAEKIQISSLSLLKMLKHG